MEKRKIANKKLSGVHTSLGVRSFFFFFGWKHDFVIIPGCMGCCAFLGVIGELSFFLVDFASIYFVPFVCISFLHNLLSLPFTLYMLLFLRATPPFCTLTYGGPALHRHKHHHLLSWYIL